MFLVEWWTWELVSMGLVSFVSWGLRGVRATLGFTRCTRDAQWIGATNFEVSTSQWRVTLLW